MSGIKIVGNSPLLIFSLPKMSSEFYPLSEKKKKERKKAET